MIPRIKFEDATLEEIIEALRLWTANLDYIEKTGINVVIDSSRITTAQLTARISIDEHDMTLEEVFYAVCKGLGVGYRIDDYAVVISSREHAGLPQPPSKRVMGVPDGRVSAYVVIVGRKTL